MLTAKSILIFILAGVCEIGGGYLLWMVVREGKSPWYAFLGAIILVLYGYVATFQTSNFARVYAAYGGFFIVLSLVWGYCFDNFRPDRYDNLGAMVVLLGAGIIYYAPR